MWVQMCFFKPIWSKHCTSEFSLVSIKFHKFSSTWTVNGINDIVEVYCLVAEIMERAISIVSETRNNFECLIE